jgi:hypothetical protein
MAGALYCDTDGTCLYPSGLLCFENGRWCCYTGSIRDQMCCVVDQCFMVPNWVAVPDPPPVQPDPEPWTPSFDDPDLVGDPGWRDSDDQLCAGAGRDRAYTSSVWSNQSGVYAVSVVEEVYNPNLPNGCGGCTHERVDFNDGSGWTEVEGVREEDNRFGQSAGALAITGFDNGPLILYGFSSQKMGQLCGLSMLEDGVRTCQPVDGVTDVQVVNDQLAYALLGGNLIRYDGTNWGPLPVDMPVQNELQFLWADSTVAVMTGISPGRIYTLRDGAMRIEDTRTLDHFASIFGFGPDDVWAGTFEGTLYHYNGTAWSQVELPEIECGQPPIYGLWGANGVLYIVTQSRVMRWDGNRVKTLAQIDCSRGAVTGFTSIWGNSENEVFIGMLDNGSFDKCGPSYLLYYDGSQFHRM